MYGKYSCVFFVCYFFGLNMVFVGGWNGGEVNAVVGPSHLGQVGGRPL